MPAMPRWNKKANKIVIELIGEPENKLGKENKKQRKISEQLITEEGQWNR